MPYAALSEILAAARYDAPAEPQITGADPVVPTRFRMGTAGAASLAALGIAVANVWEQRGGRCQRIAIDLRAAGASLRSSRYLRIDGKPVQVWDPMSGYYPVRDGWISIHCNFPQHRAAALKVLGVEEIREKAESKSAAWSGEALEDAIHAAGGCAGFVRSAEQWRAHPQARAVARQPLVEIERIGDAPPEPLPFAKRPLAGVRVLDLTRVLAGPTCARSLAEHGADVLKINAPHLADMGKIELDTGLGKLSARLDLREEADLAKLRALIKSGDVFSQSYRPGSLGARGFSPPALAALRPGIVYVSLSAWGTTGPWRDRRGFDSIVQSVSGMAHTMGLDAGMDAGSGGKPKLQPVSAIDYVSGYLMAFGAALAIARRAREGGSWLVRVALARVGQWIVDRGVVPDSAWRGLPEELPEAELAPLLAEVDSPYGRVRHLKPVLQMAETPPYWSRPPVPLGTHPPEWPERENR